MNKNLTHLQQLEAESIHILREVVAEFENPVMLYSIGKDSAVMLHLARKAFYPAPPPFPLLHVDTTWKFREMIEFRDKMAAECGLDLIVHVNEEGVSRGISPFTHGSALYTDVMKTEGLKQALDRYKFDAAFGGARRDEEKSRAKERIFSFRSANHRWDPKNQRPELWNLYNGCKKKGEHFRVFPLSNWTELDIWTYIQNEGIRMPSLYFTHRRTVVRRDGVLLAESPYVALLPGETWEELVIRFRTVGDMSCTGATESRASTIEEIVAEISASRVTERGGRADDKRSDNSMEDRKREGYF
jgi:sulfate adenylyltransferase subunit 2